jgi:hypothetical protein
MTVLGVVGSAFSVFLFYTATTLSVGLPMQTLESRAYPSIIPSPYWRSFVDKQTNDLKSELQRFQKRMTHSSKRDRRLKLVSNFPETAVKKELNGPKQRTQAHSVVNPRNPMNRSTLCPTPKRTRIHYRLVLSIGDALTRLPRARLP